MSRRRTIYVFALAVTTWLGSTAASVRLIGADAGPGQAAPARGFDTGRLQREISFDCDPSQLHGAARLVCIARRFEEGRRLFDEETFGGNGRTCVTCHSVKNDGTFSPEDAQQRLAVNPDDPLFVGDGLDDGIQGTARITAHATVRVDIDIARQARQGSRGNGRHLPSGNADDAQYACTAIRVHVRRTRHHARGAGARRDSRPRAEHSRTHRAAARAHCRVPADGAAFLLLLAAADLRSRWAAAPASEGEYGRAETRARDVRQRAYYARVDQGYLCRLPQRPMLDVAGDFNVFGAPPGLQFFSVGVSERNKLNLPTYEFILDGVDTVVTPDIGMILTEPMPPEFPPGIPLIFVTSLFKTPTVWGVKHTAPYFHDNSAKTLEEIAEHRRSSSSSLSASSSRGRTRPTLSRS